RPIGSSGRSRALLGHDAGPHCPGYQHGGIEDSSRGGEGALAGDDLLGLKDHAARGAPDRNDRSGRLDVVPTSDGGQELDRFVGPEEPLVPIVMDRQFRGQVAEEAKDVRPGNQRSPIMDVGVAYPYSQGGPRVLPVPRHGWAPWGWASSTCSAARIGAPTRRAKATAALGRGEHCVSRPSTWRTRVA